MIDFLTANWLWLAVPAVMVFMHLGGRGCGAHARHHRDRHTATDSTQSTHKHADPPREAAPTPQATEAPSGPRPTHRDQ